MLWDWYSYRCLQIPKSKLNRDWPRGQEIWHMPSFLAWNSSVNAVSLVHLTRLGQTATSWWGLVLSADSDPNIMLHVLGAVGTKYGREHIIRLGMAMMPTWGLPRVPLEGAWKEHHLYRCFPRRWTWCALHCARFFQLGTFRSYMIYHLYLSMDIWLRINIL